jgi:hypothetical protein
VPASNFDYAIIRVVPRVERDEFINAGVIVHSPTLNFLEARVELDEARLHALWPEADVEELKAHLEVFPRIARGDKAAGPIAQLPRGQRFHWLVAPRSTERGYLQRTAEAVQLQALLARALAEAGLGGPP